MEDKKYSIILTTIAKDGHSIYNGNYGGGWKWDLLSPSSALFTFGNEKDAEIAITNIEKASNMYSLEYKVVRLWENKNVKISNDEGSTGIRKKHSRKATSKR